jgi:hypothetical protein
MTTILFVHGTGTRRTQFDATFEIIKQNLLSRRPDLTVKPCYWGEPLGAELYANGASIPDYSSTREPEEMKKEDQLVALWEQLYRDPLFELRLLSIVDLLVKRVLPQVQLLVTVGPQAPFFYEINTLHSLAWQDSLPPHFPGLHFSYRLSLIHALGSPAYPLIFASRYRLWILA